jgi:hypothetical protein
VSRCNIRHFAPLPAIKCADPAADVVVPWCRVPGTPLDTPHTLCLDDDVMKAIGFQVSVVPRPAMSRFLTHLALCNTVVPSRDDAGTLHYQVRPWARRAAQGVLPGSQLGTPHQALASSHACALTPPAHRSWPLGQLAA